MLCAAGNSRTTAVVCAAPEPSNAEQTLSALRFGEDCGTIATKVSLQGVRSVKHALETIVLALNRCEADLAALAARGEDVMIAVRPIRPISCMSHNRVPYLDDEAPANFLSAVS